MVSGNSPDMHPNIEDLILPDHREVVMTISEYEERFRSPPPSLHQTFAAACELKRRRWRSHCFWVAAVLVGVMTMTFKLASYHTVHTGTESLASTEIQQPMLVSPVVTRN